MWKRLLVGLDGSRWSEAAAEFALALAARYGAEVEGVFVSDVRLTTPPIQPADMLGAPLDLPAAPFLAIEREERARGDDVLARFVARGQASGARITTALELGVPAKVLLARLRGADAVFVGRQGHMGGGQGLGSTARAVAWESVRPVFVAPERPRELRSILLAYDGSPEALRACRVACELAECIASAPCAAFSYALVTADPDAAAAAAVQGDALVYLGAHGIRPQRVIRKEAPVEAILGAARELGADLVIAGSFGHTRIREMLVGSVARDLLRLSEVPILVHH